MDFQVKAIMLMLDVKPHIDWWMFQPSLMEGRPFQDPRETGDINGCVSHRMGSILGFRHDLGTLGSS